MLKLTGCWPKDGEAGNAAGSILNSINETLRYLEVYHDETVIVKMGGELAQTPDVLDKILKQVLALKRIGVNVMVVHGGGPQLTDVLNAERVAKGLPPKNKADMFDADGERITAPDEIDTCHKVFAETNLIIVNEMARIIAEEQADPNVQPHKRIKVSGYDGRYLFNVKPKNEGSRTGVITSVNIDEFKKFTDPNNLEIPIFYSICFDEHGRAYNINADKMTAAFGVTSPAKIIFVTNVTGVKNEHGEVMPEITLAQIEDMKARGVIYGGMVAKVDSLVGAIRYGAQSVTIVQQNENGSILLELLTEGGIGTSIDTRKKQSKPNMGANFQPA